MPLIPRLLAALLILSPAMAVADGAQLFRQHCAACHQTGPGSENRIGPHLTDIIGRNAASVAGYTYSPAMQAKGAEGLIWTADALDQFLTRPKDVVPGTKMAFAGMRNAQTRADLVAWLGTDTKSPTATLDPAILAIKGDTEYGEYLGSECLACHHKDGQSQGIPVITGWPVEDFVVAMHQFKQKERPNPVMQMIAGRLGNEEIAALAAWFAQNGP